MRRKEQETYSHKKIINKKKDKRRNFEVPFMM